MTQPETTSTICCYQCDEKGYNGTEYCERHAKVEAGSSATTPTPCLICGVPLTAATPLVVGWRYENARREGYPAPETNPAFHTPPDTTARRTNT